MIEPLKRLNIGYVLRLDTAPIRKVSCLLSGATNNLNQLAKHANETGDVCAKSIREMQVELSDLYAQLRTAMRRLAKF